MYEDRSMGAVANPLVPCVDCGSAVSRRAVTCPSCGREIRLGPWSLLTRGGRSVARFACVFGVLLPLLLVAIYLAAIYVAGSL
jgi:hypothetical protein